MSDTMSSSSHATASKSARQTVDRDPYAQILSLAADIPSLDSFFSDVLKVITTTFASPYAAVYISSGPQVIEDEWHSGPTDPAFWKSTVQRFLSESLETPTARARLLNSKKGDMTVALISTPIVDPPATVIGAISLVVTPIDESDMSQYLSRLESLVTLASYLAKTHGDARNAKRSSSAPLNRGELASVDELSTPQQLAFAVTNNLRAQLSCEQVALGVVDSGCHVKIVAVSGLDQIAGRNPGIVPLQAAMEECLDFDAPIVSQLSDGSTDDRLASRHRLHSQWRTAAGGDAVASIPIHVDSELLAIVSVRRSGDRPLTSDFINDIHSRLEPIIPILTLTQKASRGLFRHACDTVGNAVRTITQPGRRKTKIVSAAVVLGVAWFLFGTIDYHLTVPCTITAARARHTAMPFDGVLASANVVAGDRVSRGDVLCRVDTKDLADEYTRLSAERVVLEHESDRAMADDLPVDVQLALAKMKLVNTQLMIVDNRIQQASIRAPTDGFVVAGDLRKDIGRVLAKGQPLFEIAPVDRLMIELNVPESDIDDLELGLSGYFAPSARPEQHHGFHVTRIHPHAETRDRANVYIAEAQTDLSCQWMYPGMEGFAKVHVGRRPVWWVVLHRGIDYVRFKLLS